MNILLLKKTFWESNYRSQITGHLNLDGARNCVRKKSDTLIWGRAKDISIAILPELYE